MAAINNVTTADAYTEAATLKCFPAASVTLTVTNAAVYYSLNLNATGTRAVPGSGNWTEDRQLLPGYWSFAASDFQGQVCTGIRLRSFLAGTPAIVSASD